VITAVICASTPEEESFFAVELDGATTGASGKKVIK